MIEVRPAGSNSFTVLVDEGDSETHHRVTVAPDDLTRLSHESETPDAFVRRCFEFLLTREPKESILGEFDISTISHYFPEFEETISG